MQKKILVVENNPVVQRTVTVILEQEGALVKTADNGLEALELLKTYRPDIIFTDLVMPLVDGEQLCKIVRSSREYGSVFLVVLSAILLEDQERALRLDCDFFIAKGEIGAVRGAVCEALAHYDLRRQHGQVPGKQKIHVVGGLAPQEVTGELLSQNRHLVALLAILREGIIELSSDGRIVSANPAALEIFDIQEEELLGVGIQTLFPEPEKGLINTWIREELSQGTGRALNIKEDEPVRIKDRILTVAFLQMIEEKRQVHVVCILRDITRRVLAELEKDELDKALRLTKKMDALSSMAGGVAHDFNNLLTVICGNLDMALFKARQGQDNLELLKQAKKAGVVAVDLIHKISTVSKVSVARRETCDLGQQTPSVLDGFFQTHLGSYQITSPEHLSLVKIDIDQFKEILTNILQNAEEAAGDLFQVDVEIENVSLPDPLLLSGQRVAAGEYVKIAIRDHGRGMDEENLTRVFDPYYTTKQRGPMKGLGLGLTVVYAVLRNHGGQVVFESAPGEGARVLMFFPAMHERARGLSL